MKTRQFHFIAMKNLIKVYHSMMDKVKGEFLLTKSHNIRTRQGLLKLLRREKQITAAFAQQFVNIRKCCDRRLWGWTASLCSKKALGNFPANRIKARN